MRWGRVIPASFSMVFLAACGGQFATDADLSAATPRTTPIPAGTYEILDRTSTKTDNRSVLSLTIQDDGTYAGTMTTGDQSTELQFSIFGPVNGVYVVQIPEDMKASFATHYYYNQIIRPSGGNAYGMSSTDMSHWIGVMYFSQFQVPPPASGDMDVTTLTDNAFLNWALIQRILVNYGNQIEFDSGELRPTKVDVQ